MLYPQIPQPILKRIASSLSIDLKLLGAEINIGAKTNPSDETRYAKVKVVSEYIQKHLDVGSIDVPSTYFRGKLSMRQGILMKQAVYFGGYTAQTIVGLSGSIHHIIGSNSSMGSDIRFPPSAVYGIQPIIDCMFSEFSADAIADKITEEQEQTLRGAAFIAQEQMTGPRQYFEFIAKTLLQDSIRLPYRQSHVVLGTPIYMAIDD